MIITSLIRMSFPIISDSPSPSLPCEPQPTGELSDVQSTTTNDDLDSIVYSMSDIFASETVETFNESLDNIPIEDSAPVGVSGSESKCGTHIEPEAAQNIVIPWVPVTGVLRDSVYHSFCTLAETCGFGMKYGEYCRHVIGGDVANIIVDNIQKFMDEL